MEYNLKQNNKKILFSSILIFLIFIFAVFFININHIDKLNKEFDKKESKNELNSEGFGLITTEKSYDKDLSFLFFGDLMLDRYVYELISRHGLEYIFSFLEKEEFTKNYDFVFANLEGAVTNNGKHYPPELLYDFAFKPEIIQGLKKYNFNIFNLANNHLADQGERGINETYQNLYNLDFYYFGCKDAYLSKDTVFPIFNQAEKKLLNHDNCSVIITEVNNYKIAWLGFSIVYQNIEEELILNKIELAKSQADWLIVSPHWGQEYQTKANNLQRQLARKMIDTGADLIIGHHPHVIQDYELYNNSYIFYSLGNFIFDQYFSAETQLGLAISLVLKNNEIDSLVLYEIETNLSSIKSINRIKKLK